MEGHKKSENPILCILVPLYTPYDLEKKALLIVAFVENSL
jgi:hypothetical protein